MKRDISRLTPRNGQPKVVKRRFDYANIIMSQWKLAHEGVRAICMDPVNFNALSTDPDN